MRLLAAALVLILGAQVTTAVPRDHDHTEADRAAHARADSEAGTAAPQAASQARRPDGRAAWTGMHDRHEGMPCGDQPLCGWGLMACADELSCASVPVLPSSLQLAWSAGPLATALAGALTSPSNAAPAVKSPPPRA